MHGDLPWLSSLILVMKLPQFDPSPAIYFSDLVRSRFGPTTSVTSLLDEFSVAAALQSVLGGLAFEFRVVPHAFWNFRFSVSSKSVGLLIHRYGWFISRHWRDGGPNYLREKAIWDLEQDAQWTTVSKDKKKSSHASHYGKFSYADSVRQSCPGHKSVFSRLHIPESLLKTVPLETPAQQATSSSLSLDPQGSTKNTGPRLALFQISNLLSMLISFSFGRVLHPTSPVY